MPARVRSRSSLIACALMPDMTCSPSVQKKRKRSQGSEHRARPRTYEQAPNSQRCSHVAAARAPLETRLTPREPPARALLALAAAPAAAASRAARTLIHVDLLPPPAALARGGRTTVSTAALIGVLAAL